MVRYRNGRLLRLTSAFTPLTAASAVARGRARRPGNSAKTVGLLIEVLSVHGNSASFWRMYVSCTLPLTVVLGSALYIPVTPNEFSVLLGHRALCPKAGPLPLL